MNARELINKLPEQVRERAYRYREVYAHCYVPRLREETRNRMAGYALGLKDAGLLTERERQLLFVYMTVEPMERV